MGGILGRRAWERSNGGLWLPSVYWSPNWMGFCACSFACTDPWVSPVADYVQVDWGGAVCYSDNLSAGTYQCALLESWGSWAWTSSGYTVSFFVTCNSSTNQIAMRATIVGPTNHLQCEYQLTGIDGPLNSEDFEYELPLVWWGGWCGESTYPSTVTASSVPP